MYTVICLQLYNYLDIHVHVKEWATVITCIFLMVNYACHAAICKIILSNLDITLCIPPYSCCTSFLVKHRPTSCRLLTLSHILQLKKSTVRKERMQVEICRFTPPPPTTMPKASTHHFSSSCVFYLFLLRLNHLRKLRNLRMTVLQLDVFVKFICVFKEWFMARQASLKLESSIVIQDQ
jgi:hypothetical protein